MRQFPNYVGKLMPSFKDFEIDGYNDKWESRYVLDRCIHAWLRFCKLPIFAFVKIIHVKPKINRKVVIYQTSDFLPRLPETRREMIMLAFDV